MLDNTFAALSLCNVFLVLLYASTVSHAPAPTGRRRSSVRATPHLLSTSLHFSVPILATPARPRPRPHSAPAPR